MQPGAHAQTRTVMHRRCRELVAPNAHALQQWHARYSLVLFATPLAQAMLLAATPTGHLTRVLGADMLLIRIEVHIELAACARAHAVSNAPLHCSEARSPADAHGHYRVQRCVWGAWKRLRPLKQSRALVNGVVMRLGSRRCKSQPAAKACGAAGCARTASCRAPVTDAEPCCFCRNWALRAT